MIQGAYAGARYASVKKLNIPCGLGDLNRVLNDFDYLLHLEDNLPAESKGKKLLYLAHQRLL